MNPYYQDDSITIYCGDCLDIIGNLDYDLVITDPPYGIRHPTNYKKRGRCGITSCIDYKMVHGDNDPFDPKPWLESPCCLWGANYFSNKLPPSSGWLVWDKKRPDDLDQATCELAWTNFVKGVRRFEFLWNGCMRASKDPLVHPTQKPIALFRWILGLRWTPEGVILDPYAGSGPCLRAAKDLGRKAIGIEIEEAYCEIMAKNLEQESLFSYSSNPGPMEYETDTLFRLDCGKLGGNL